MKKFVFVICFLISSLLLHASDYPKLVQKRIEKTLVKLFPTMVVELKEMAVSTELTSVYSAIREVKVSRLKSTDYNLGYACFASSKGKHDYFDYMVIFDRELVIKQVQVLIYRSSYGGEIMSKSWLKQFIGKANGQEMTMDKDIDGISGATLSAPSITQGIKELSLLLVEISKQNPSN